MALDLVVLDRDHPGFRDPVYRKRRNAIAQMAIEYRPGCAVPEVDYTEEEQEVWRTVWAHLGPLHERLACAEVRAAEALLPLDRERVPQLAEVNRALARSGDMQLAPVAGLMTPFDFLDRLGRGVFLATQYMRHHSHPFYTPEPDVIHELVGHAASLAHPRLSALNRSFGEAVHGMDPGAVQAVIRAYWYTLEFGLVLEGGHAKAIGAGLLSSYGELGGFEEHAEIVPYDLDVIAETSFDPTDYQRRLFVADGFEALERTSLDWLRRWREKSSRSRQA
jgi:phenylalanine-4-hydroxylase